MIPVADIAAAYIAAAASSARIGGGRFTVALQRDPYIDLDRTYGALGSYVADHGIGAEGPIREHYLLGPAEAGDPTQLRTEVCWPISG